MDSSSAPTPDPEFLTRQEVADLLRVDVQTVDRLARNNRLTRYRLQTGEQRARTRYRTDEVRALIQREEPS